MADRPSGAIGEGIHSQAQTAPVVAVASSTGQVSSNEAKDQPADVTAKKQTTSDGVQTTQAINAATPNASGDKSTSVSSEVETPSTHETAPAKTVAEPELGENSAPPPLPKDTSDSAPPPPEKDTTVTNKPATTTSEETSVSPSQTADPALSKAEDADKADNPLPPPTKPEAAPANVEGAEPDAVEESSKPQSSDNGDNRAVDEGSSAAQDDNGKPGGGNRPTLRIDRIRELSTASLMSATPSTPGTPADETASSALEQDEEGGTPQSANPSGKAKKKKKPKKKKGEKNSPRLPSETVNTVDNSTVQDLKPVPTAPVLLGKEGEGGPVEKADKVDSAEGDGELVEKMGNSGEGGGGPVEKADKMDAEGDGELVEKAESSGEDSAVVVEKPQAEAETTADDAASGSDEWAEFEAVAI